MRLACLAVMALFAAPFAANGASTSASFMGRQAVILEGDWSADAALADLRKAPEQAGTSGVLNLGNDGLWHWVRMDVSATAKVGSYLEIAISALSAPGMDNLPEILVSGGGVII